MSAFYNDGVLKDAEMSDNIVSDVSPKMSKLQAVDLQVVEECGLWRKLDNRYLVNKALEIIRCEFTGSTNDQETHVQSNHCIRYLQN